jgi:hypothetical protein
MIVVGWVEALRNPTFIILNYIFKSSEISRRWVTTKTDYSLNFDTSRASEPNLH